MLNPAQAMAEHPGVEIMCATRWASLRRLRVPDMGIHGYDFLHEDRCRGMVMAVLPHRFVPSLTGGYEELEFLLRWEITPCWSLEPVFSALTGGVENHDDPREDVVRELEEEAGYRIAPDDLRPLGTCRGQKSSTNIYALYGVDLTGVVQGEPTNDDPDDTVNEGVAKAVWVTSKTLLDVEDAQVSVMALRILNHLSEYVL